MKTFNKFIKENNGVSKLGGTGIGTTQDQQAIDHNINSGAINNPKVLGNDQIIETIKKKFFNNSY